MKQSHAASKNVGFLGKILGWSGVLFLVMPLLTACIVSFEPGSRLRFPPSGVSFRWYLNSVLNPEWALPLERSILFGACSSVLAVAIGMLAAYGLTRAGRWKSIVSSFFMLPIFIPPVVLGVGQYFWFGHLGLIDTGLALVLAHVSITFPIAFVFGVGALTDGTLMLEDAACTLGAARWYAFARITARSISPAAVAAGFLCFVTAFDESVLSLFLANQKVKTLPRQMFDGLRYDLDPTVAAIAGLATLLWVAVIVTSMRYRMIRV